MGSRRRCPDCGSEVEVPELVPDDQVGCYNVEDHEGTEPLVMWPADGEEGE